MPIEVQGKSKYPPLTEQEKKEIIARHKDLVDKFNAILPDDQKVSYDKNLLRKLNDPKMVSVYRIGQEMKGVLAKQEQIRERLEFEYGKYNEKGKTNPFTRNFNSFLRVDDTEEAKEYNKKLYQDFLHNTDRLAYIRYKDVLNINPQEIVDCKGDDLKLAEYFKKNFHLLKDGFEYGNCFKYVDATPGMEDGYNAIKSQLNYVGRIEKQIVIIGGTYDYFAMPEINTNQAQIMAERLGEFLTVEKGNQTIVPYVQGVLEKGKEDIFTLFEKMQAEGVELAPGAIMKYKPITKDKYNGYEKEVDLYKFMNPEERDNPNANYTFKKRTDDEIKRIRLITSDASYQYANEWRARFEQRTNLGPVDPEKYESRLQLGFVSRLFNKNSRQYDILMKTFKDYNNPNSKDYLNEDKLREAAVNYSDRKANQGYTGQGNSLDDRRKKFADDIIATCDQCKAEQKKIFREIDSEFLFGYPPKKEPFLSKEDVEEKEYVYQADTKELEKEINYDKDFENINDISIQ